MIGTSKDIKNPGLRTLPPGVERYFVKGGGISVIEVFPEDKIDLINNEGKQISEIVVFNSKGKSELSILELKENSNAEFCKQRISHDEKISKLFKKKNLDLNKAKSAIVFSPDCPMGEKISLKSKDKCIVMIAAPGNDMNVHNQNPPSDLTIFLNRAHFQEKEEQYFLPDPLGDPNNEKFIKRSTAESYAVKAGEFIQIIDTGGRQCSDFLAFDTRNTKGLAIFPVAAS